MPSAHKNFGFSIPLLAVLILSRAGAITVEIAVTVHEVAEILAVLDGLRARIGVGLEA